MASWEAMERQRAQDSFNAWAHRSMLARQAAEQVADENEARRGRVLALEGALRTLSPDAFPGLNPPVWAEVLLPVVEALMIRDGS